MKSWARPADILATLRRRWLRGDYLADSLEPKLAYPLRLPIRGPTSREITADFAAVRDWIADWRAERAIQCEWATFTHRLFGTNEMPKTALFPDVASVVRCLGVTREWETFHRLAETTHTNFPELRPWVIRRTGKILELASQWHRLLAVVAWVREHPRGGCYLRQIDAPGVHTKFIEEHRGVLAELLDIVLPHEALDLRFSGTSGFARRYGFRDRPERVRFRFLDPACAMNPEILGLDLELPATAFARLNPAVERVFITENEINFLAFPAQEKSLLIFGRGYGWTALQPAEWLRRCEIWYWGDIDTHGFAILDQLREQFPNVRSFLMDPETFKALREFHTTEPQPFTGRVPRLTPSERAAYNLLRQEGESVGLRLEQERVPYHLVEEALSRITNG